MSSIYNILVSGVGGQGSLVAGSVIGTAGMSQGLRPVLGEIFGASRRGGSVTTHIRLAEKDFGPLIPKGHVDLLLGMEPMEALRSALELASERTIVVVNSVPVQTTTSLARESEYPELGDVLDALSSLCGAVYVVDATAALEKIGNTRALNMFLLGVMAGIGETPLKMESLRDGIIKNLRDSATSLLTFDEGIKYAENIEPHQAKS